MLSLVGLTRLTVAAGWMDDETIASLFSASASKLRCRSLRCLQLIAQHVGQRQYDCPQTDVGLRFLVKPHLAWTAAADGEMNDEERDPQWEALSAHDPLTQICPFPALECLDLPLAHHRDSDSDSISEGMLAALERSYSFQQVDDWEMNVETLGRAEWRKQQGLTMRNIWC